MKLCNVCLITKPETDFYSGKAHCKPCLLARKREYYEKNKDKLKKQSKEYYEKNKDKKKEYYEKNKDSVREIQKEYSEKNKDKHRERCKAYYLKNKEKLREGRKKHFKKYYEKNKDKVKEAQKKYRQRNKHYYAQKAREREGVQKNATPDWLSDEQKAHIKRTYKLRDIITDATGIDYHVDHIIPLKGENVCGLHVPWNLRVIPAKDNLSKGNKTPS